MLYQIETHVRGRSPEARRAARQQYAVPLLNALHAWMIKTVSELDSSSKLVEAFNYSLKRWAELCRYTEDGRLEIDNGAAERSIRGMGIGRRNYLFFGSDSGGERAAIIYSLIESCLCRIRHRAVHAERQAIPNRRAGGRFSEDLLVLHSA